MTMEYADPMRKYVDGKFEELNKNLLLTQRTVAAYNVRLVSFMFSLSLDFKKLKILNAAIKKETQDALNKIDKSNNPLDVADEFISDIKQIAI
jgi:hypothetical protein